MRSKLIVSAIVIVALVGVEMFSWADQILTGRIKLLVDRGSLKVVAMTDFPDDLGCDVHVGPKPYPFYYTEGTHGTLDSAGICITPDSSVSVRKKHDGSYLLALNDESNGVLFWDFDCNGQWDVKKTTKPKCGIFIFFDKDWLEVNMLTPLTSVRPTATKGENKFEFVQGEWHKLKNQEGRTTGHH